MIDRMKELRKTLGISQQEFAEKINLKQNSIALIETGKRNPSDRTLLDICREFNVNEHWLRTGEGEMFEKIPEEDEFFKAATQISISDDKLAMQAVIEYWKLDEESKKLLKDFILHIVEKSKK